MVQENDTGKVSGKSPSGPSCHDWLAAHRRKLEENCARYRRLEAKWSWIRLLAFVAGAAIAVLLRHELPLAIGAGIVGLAGFAATVLRHAGWEDKRTFTEHALTIVAESLDAGAQRDHPIRGWQRPEDPTVPSATLPSVLEPGPTWALTDQERDDLDLHGPPMNSASP